jgi:hypothetical protein
MVNPYDGVAPDPTTRLAVLYAGTGTGTVVVCGITVSVGITVGGVVAWVVRTGGGFAFCWTQPPITIIPSTTIAKIHDVRIFSPTPFPHPSPGRIVRLQGNALQDIYSLTFLTDFETTGNQGDRFRIQTSFYLVKRHPVPGVVLVAGLKDPILKPVPVCHGRVPGGRNTLI